MSNLPDVSTRWSRGSDRLDAICVFRCYWCGEPTADEEEAGTLNDGLYGVQFCSYEHAQLYEQSVLDKYPASKTERNLTHHCHLCEDHAKRAEDAYAALEWLRLRYTFVEGQLVSLRCSIDEPAKTEYTYVVRSREGSTQDSYSYYLNLSSAINRTLEPPS